MHGTLGWVSDDTRRWYSYFCHAWFVNCARCRTRTGILVLLLLCACSIHIVASCYFILVSIYQQLCIVNKQGCSILLVQLWQTNFRHFLHQKSCCSIKENHSLSAEQFLATHEGKCCGSEASNKRGTFYNDPRSNKNKCTVWMKHTMIRNIYILGCWCIIYMPETHCTNFASVSIVNRVSA